MLENFMRYRLPDDQLAAWCQRPAWTVEEAVALSLGLDPARISPATVVYLLSEFLRNGSSPPMAATIFAGRLNELVRAVKRGELPVAPSGDLTPFDSLDWMMRQNLRRPWNALPRPLLLFHTGCELGFGPQAEQADAATAQAPLQGAEPPTTAKATQSRSPGRPTRVPEIVRKIIGMLKEGSLTEAQLQSLPQKKLAYLLGASRLVRKTARDQVCCQKLAPEFLSFSE